MICSDAALLANAEQVCRKQQLRRQTGPPLMGACQSPVTRICGILHAYPELCRDGS